MGVLTMLRLMNDKLDSLLSMKKTLDSIEVSIQVMSDKCDDLLSHVQQKQKKIKALGRRIEQIEQAKLIPLLEKLENDGV